MRITGGEIQKKGFFRICCQKFATIVRHLNRVASIARNCLIEVIHVFGSYVVLANTSRAIPSIRDDSWQRQTDHVVVGRKLMESMLMPILTIGVVV